MIYAFRLQVLSFLGCRYKEATWRFTGKDWLSSLVLIQRYSKCWRKIANSCIIWDEIFGAVTTITKLCAFAKIRILLTFPQRYGLLVVNFLLADVMQIAKPQSSSFPGAKMIYLDTDHSGVAKFNGLQDENFTQVLPEIQKMVRDGPSSVIKRYQDKSKEPTPIFVRFYPLD